MQRTSAHERALIWLLRIGGVVTLLALGAVFMPVEWMAATHAWLGLGEFPRSPIVDYLTRSISAFYAFHGGLLLLLSFDVRRYARVVLYVAIASIVFGLLLFGIDLHAGLPLRWTLCEGPPVVLISIAILYLVRRVAAE
jgi:hypothetical protein